MILLEGRTRSACKRHLQLIHFQGLWLRSTWDLNILLLCCIVKRRETRRYTDWGTDWVSFQCTDCIFLANAATREWERIKQNTLKEGDEWMDQRKGESKDAKTWCCIEGGGETKGTKQEWDKNEGRIEEETDHTWKTRQMKKWRQSRSDETTTKRETQANSLMMTMASEKEEEEDRKMVEIEQALLQE